MPLAEQEGIRDEAERRQVDIASAACRQLDVAPI
jgi:hypothetical protein